MLNLNILYCRSANLVRQSFPRLFLDRHKMDLSDVRRPYKSSSEGFSDNDLASKDPFLQFASWHEEAKAAGAAYEINAACLATCSSLGIPSARMVLLKSYGHDGFRFYTNYCSRKGEDLISNPIAAILIYWDTMHRQIRIEGPVEKVPMDMANEYFQQRPRSSQLSAACSPQSSVIKREDLLQKYDAMSKAYSDENVPVPKPETWGGFSLIPESFEFWQGQSNRLHDRIRFRKLAPNEKADGDMIREAQDGWVIETLAP